MVAGSIRKKKEVFVCNPLLTTAAAMDTTVDAAAANR
jgi:hypothetical protein